MSNSTKLIHSDYRPPAGFGGLAPGVYRASTVTYPDVATMRAADWRRTDVYTYGLHGTPTTFTLEERIARLEGGAFTLLTPSGLAAIAMVDLALLKSGDSVLLPDNAYGPSRDICGELLAPLGIVARFYDPLDVEDLESQLDATTRLVWVESPGSVTMEVSDVPALAAAAHRHGALVALDITWATGLFLDGFGAGADIVVHALTKYPSGGSDLLMGGVVFRSQDLYQRVKAAHRLLGYGVTGDDAYLVLRGLLSLEPRLKQHEASALTVARWVQSQAGVARVRHPALSSCPGHEVFVRDFRGSSGLFAIEFERSVSAAAADAFIDRLRLFRIGYSWGGAFSLAVPYDLRKTRTRVPWQGGPLVRLYVGLEHPEDLIADLKAAWPAVVPAQED